MSSSLRNHNNNSPRQQPKPSITDELVLDLDIEYDFDENNKKENEDDKNISIKILEEAARQSFTDFQPFINNPENGSDDQLKEDEFIKKQSIALCLRPKSKKRIKTQLWGFVSRIVPQQATTTTPNSATTSLKQNNNNNVEGGVVFGTVTW
jgi:hypothetical protein